MGYDMGSSRDNNSGGYGGTGRGGPWGGFDFNTNNNIGRAQGSKADSVGSHLGGGNTGSNNMYALDPRTGRVVQVGAPSRMGGMLTTAIGGQLGHLANGIGGIGSLNWNGASMSNKASPFHQGYYSNNQRNIRNRFAAKKKAEALDRAVLGKKDPFSRILGVKAAYHGNLPELEGFLGQPSAMRETHDVGGIWGSIAHAKGDDVESTFETRDKLEAGGHLDKHGNKTGWGPVNMPGYLSSLTSSYLPGKVAQATYDQTGSIPTAKALGMGVKKGMDSYGYKAQPNAITQYAKGFLSDAIPGRNGMKDKAVDFAASVPTMALSAATGAPVGTIGQMIGAMDTAATLNSYGITASPNAPQQGYSDVWGNGSEGGLLGSSQRQPYMSAANTPGYGRLFYERRLWS